ncbi:lecithin retinol acyltransferase family protein [Bacillus sp. NPDC094106]|uniref:lecithin retinol acyltransferase family protein n=1 Tax=Bacillus sp. NPDC094106 TaxID=3363949 RepID=UPI00381FF3BB
MKSQDKNHIKHKVGMKSKIAYKAKEYVKHKTLTTTLTGGIVNIPSIVNPLINKIKYRKTYTEPGLGAPIYCDLGFGMVEHSGIYIGNFEAVHLNGKGLIEIVNLFEFTDHITTVSRDIFFPMDKNNGTPISFESAYHRALRNIGRLRKYNIILNNCHQFTSGCLTGEFEQHDKFLDFMKCTAENIYGDQVIWNRWNWISQIGE